MIKEESPTVGPKDIIFFTLHKSASVFISKVSYYLTQLAGMPLYSPNHPDTSERVDERILLSDTDFWQNHQGCFAPVRSFVDLPNLDNYNIILHLRDPRDVLVSMFFSYCYIHSGSIEPNTGYRKLVADQGIDAFVINKAREGSSTTYVGGYGTGGLTQHLTGGLVARYRNFIDRLLGRDNVIFVQYEEMVLDFNSWLEKIIAVFPLADRQSAIDYLESNKAEFFPRRTQDVMRHIRHITPGDHKNKLQPATINELNSIFSDILDALGYTKG